MSRWKKLLWGIGLLVLALVGVFFWAYRGTRITLQSAEAFQFRRMLVSTVGDDGEYRFFYASNRRLAPGEGSVQERFVNERRDALELGSFDTAIEPSVGLGMFLNASDWFRDEEIRVRDVQPLARAAFVEQLRDQVERSPHRSLLIIVHGYREAFDSALRKTAFVGHVLDIDSPMLRLRLAGRSGGLAARATGEHSGRPGASGRGARRDARARRPGGAARAAVAARQQHGRRGGDRRLRVALGVPDLADAETEIEDVVLTAPDVEPRGLRARVSGRDHGARPEPDRLRLLQRPGPADEPPRQPARRLGESTSIRPARISRRRRSRPSSWSSPAASRHPGRRHPRQPDPQLPQLQPRDARSSSTIYSCGSTNSTDAPQPAAVHGQDPRR